MNEQWFCLQRHDALLVQGDIILNCPLLTWLDVRPHYGDADGDEFQALAKSARVVSADAVVMTQSCDLEHNKTRWVTLCAHTSIEEHRLEWENELRTSNQNPTTKAWRSYCEDLRDGYVWSHAMLNGAHCDGVTMGIRVVDFGDVFTIPKGFLESLLIRRGQARLCLVSPYREHLSQAFARFFMRVGLPTAVATEW